MNKIYTEPKQTNSLIKILGFVWSLIWFMAVILIVLKFVVYQQVTVDGESMYPNYEDSQLLLINVINKDFHRGQVVALYEDEGVAKDATYFTRFSATFFLKRVVALPGESIEIIGGDVIIYNDEHPDGALLVESYIPDSTKNAEDNRRYYLPKTKIEEDRYYVLGDNRSNSSDSRVYGSFAEFAVFGQETLRFWPIQDRTLFDLPEYSFRPVSSELKLKRQNLETSQSATTRQNPIKRR